MHMNITFQGTNLELTDELKKFVLRKIDDASRAFGDFNLDPVQISIELERTTRRHPQARENEQLFRAEANVSVPGHLIRVEESAMDIEQSVVKMKHTLTREIRHWRERLIEEKRKGARKAKQMRSEDGSDLPIPTVRTEDWEEDWASEEEKIRKTALEKEDEKWEEWEEGGEDQRDYI